VNNLLRRLGGGREALIDQSIPDGHLMAWGEWIAFVAAQRSDVISELRSLCRHTDNGEAGEGCSVHHPVDSLFSAVAMALTLNGGELIGSDINGVTALFHSQSQQGMPKSTSCLGRALHSASLAVARAARVARWLRGGKADCASNVTVMASLSLGNDNPDREGGKIEVYSLGGEGCLDYRHLVAGDHLYHITTQPVFLNQSSVVETQLQIACWYRTVSHAAAALRWLRDRLRLLILLLDRHKSLLPH